MATYLHRGQGGYSLNQLIRIAQAVIYWEPAMEALIPKSRGGGIYYARSNCRLSPKLLMRYEFKPLTLALAGLNNPKFYKDAKSRKQAMDDISKCTSVQDLIDLMNPNCKYFGFNFKHANARIGTIEFRRGLACTSRGGALKWAEVASSFIYAAYKAPDRRVSIVRFLRASALTDVDCDSLLPNIQIIVGACRSGSRQQNYHTPQVSSTTGI